VPHSPTKLLLIDASTGDNIARLVISYRNSAPPRSCYSCIHLQYRGPIGVLPDDEADKDPGRYHCKLFEESRGSATQTPRPLLDRCKETR
jgi:hypothetical protein